MTCARRPAGARTPAPSTSAGSRRPDARTGRARARRLPLLLPVLALLAGALSLFAPATAEARTTLWSGTLTVGTANDEAGCGSQSGGACSGRLTTDTVTLEGKAYLITEIVVRNWQSPPDLKLKLFRKFPQAGQLDNPHGRIWKRLTLQVGGKSFDAPDAPNLNDIGAAQSALEWDNAGLSWTSGQQVQARLFYNDQPSVPRNVRAIAIDNQVTLNWDAPSSWGDGTAGGFQIEWKPTDLPPDNWTPVNGGAREYEVGASVSSFVLSGTQRLEGRSNRVIDTRNSYDLRVRAFSANPKATGDWVEVTAERVARVTLSASPNPVQEGSPVTVTATLSAPLSVDVSIPLNTAMMPQNAATAGAYDIAIPAGQTTGTHEFTAPQLEDGEMKQYQIAVDWWRMRKSTPLILKGSQSLAGVTVLDENADPHRVSVSDASGTEMANGYPRMCFAFTLDRAASHEIWVNYWTEDGTAVAGQDYRGVEPSNMAIAFEPGETRKRKCISILDDSTEDSGETFSMVLANPHGAVLGRDRGTGTIYNHEPTSLSSLTAEGAPGEDGPFTALDIGTFAPATTTYSATVPHGTTHVRLTPKSLNRYLTITTGLDGKKKSQVPFGGGTGPAIALAVGENVLVVKTQLYTGQRQTYRVTVTRQAAPAAVEVTLSATPNPVQEGSPVTVRATLAKALSEAVTVPLTVTRATSEDGDHGSLASIEIPVGGTSATGTITTTDDADGDDETFTVALGSLPSGLAAGSASSVEVTITDSGLQQSTEPLTAAFENVPSEHDGTAFTFDLTLSEAPGAGNLPVAASFKVAPGKASVSGSGTRYTVTVTPKAANAWKDVTITLAGGRACAEAGAVCTADGRALSNTSTTTVGGPVRIRIEGARAKEGKDASLDFAVTLNRAASHEVSVDYATQDETATAGADYTATSGTLTFAAGETAKTVSVPVLDDAIDEGKETMRLLLSNPKGAYLRGVHSKAKGVIRNDDTLQQAWLARFGRMVASDAVASVTARLETPRDAGSHVTFAGQRMNFGEAEGGGGAALATVLTGLAQTFGAPSAPAADEDDPFARLGLTDPWSDPASSTARSMTGRELLLGTSFRAVLGQGAGSQWTSWGQGASVSQFSAAAAGLDLSGESATGSMGMDYEHGRLLTGFAMTHSVGEGTAEDEGWRYALGSTATMAMPYARLALTDRISAWGLAGTGSGTLSLDLDGAVPQSYRTDLSMTLAAAGVRGDLVKPVEAGGFALALKADAFWVRTESEGISASRFGNLAGAQGESSRVRAVLDGSRTFALSGGAALTPSVELGLRHDGGDAETGTGVEFGTGLGYADPSRGLDMALKVHGLAVHDEDGYDEWGVSGQLRLVPGGSGRGLSASFTPSYGVDPGGTERLWALPDAHALSGNEEAAPSNRLDTEFGYGLPVFGGGFTGTPNVGFGLSEAARDYRIGWRLTPAAPSASGFEVNLDAVRREAANEYGAEHGVMLRSLLRW